MPAPRDPGADGSNCSAGVGSWSPTAKRLAIADLYRNPPPRRAEHGARRRGHGAAAARHGIGQYLTSTSTRYVLVVPYRGRRRRRRLGAVDLPAVWSLNWRCVAASRVVHHTAPVPQGRGGERRGSRRFRASCSAVVLHRRRLPAAVRRPIERSRTGTMGQYLEPEARRRRPSAASARPCGARRRRGRSGRARFR